MSQLTYQSDLTDEMIAEAQALVGQPLRIEQWNHEASLDGIRHWSWGIGDNNPLYCDEEYAASTDYGQVIAPPTYLATVYSGQLGVGMVGVQPFAGGYHWKFLETVKRGDRLSVDARIGPVQVSEGSHTSRFAIQTTANQYFRADGTLLATSEGRTLRVPRSKASGGLSYAPREPHRYTADELDAIRVQAVTEPRRGSNPRYWEEVSVGDPVPQVVKGPIDITTMMAYYCGLPGTPRYKSAEMAWLYRTWATESPERLPNNYDPFYYAESVSPSAGHARADVALELGMPGAYNNGTQTMAWMAHAVTNWMGDAGFLAELEVKLRRPAIFQDTVWCGGIVTELLTPDRVSITLKAFNQLDDTVAEGVAVVRLPARKSTVRR